MSGEASFRMLTIMERAALRQRTARALGQIWQFKDLPVQVAAPCPECGGLFWYITGNERIAPTGYCLNCRPDVLANRADLVALVEGSMQDEQSECPEAGQPLSLPWPPGAD